MLDLGAMNTVNRFLLEHNRQQSDFFLSPGEVSRRDLYVTLHPTLVMIEKCMDGRVNVPVMTDGEVPMGVSSPYRNMGGKFVIGSPSFAHYVRNFHSYALRMMKESGGHVPGGLNIATYHFSAGDHHRGCKGFSYDTDAARSHTAGLTADFSRVFGETHEVVHPIQMGIETDRESFIFHGDVPGLVLNIAEALDLSPRVLRRRMRELYPTMKERIFNDLMPFVLGNQRHVSKVIKEGKEPIALQHTEQVICPGRGYDWLHVINKALIIGPFSVDWLNEVVVAADIVLGNFKAGRIPREEGAVVLVSAPYREDGVDAEVAKMKALEMARLSWAAIRERVPELLDYNLELVAGALERRSMLLHRLDLPADLAYAANRTSMQSGTREAPRSLQAA